MRIHALVLALALGATTVPALAHDDAAMTSTATVREEILASYNDAADKILQLAEAIPAEKYTWRPAEGVRSISEAMMHVAGANFFFGRLLGFPPAEPQKDLEKETDKAKVVAKLKESIEHGRKALQQATDAELDRKRDMFGTMRSGRAVALILASHAHEHLGQLIAYARSVGVMPPWSS